MSKGNMLLGYARGKVGDVVMARALGKQQTRAYNDKPKNPKTESQMNQRVKMLNLINFYKFSKNYLQYEKGGSNTKYSTFNKFVRYNIAATPNYLTKEQFLNNDAIPNGYYYSIGSLAWPQIPFTIDSRDSNGSVNFNWELGNVNQFPFSFQSDDKASYVLSKLFSYFGAKTTNAILTVFGQYSDAITGVATDAFSFSINPADFEGYTYSNLNSTIRLQGGKFEIMFNVGSEIVTLNIKINMTNADNSTHYSYAQCWSATDGGRLKVSTSKIELSSALSTLVTSTYQTETARIDAINSYKVGEPIELRTGTPID